MFRITILILINLFLLSPFIVQAQEGHESGLGKSWIFYPVFGFQPETRFQFGAVALGVFNSSDSTQSEYQRRSSFTPFVIYTTRNQFLSAFNIDYFLKSGKNLNVTPRFYNFPDRFFGIGNSNDPELFENYTNQYVQLEGQLSIPKSNNFFYGIAFDFPKLMVRKVELLSIRKLLWQASGNYFASEIVGECESDRIEIAVSVDGCTITGVDPGAGPDILLNPTLTTGNVTVELGQSQGYVTIRVMDLQGKQQALATYPSSGAITFDITGPGGIYLVEVLTSSFGASTFRVLKK